MMIDISIFCSRKKSVLLSLTTSALLTVTLGLSTQLFADGATRDAQACYAWDAFPNERINIGVRNGGPLSSADEVVVQRTHGVHGKLVGSCGEGTNAALSGALVIAEGIGSHLGIYSPQSRGGEKFNRDDHCRSVSIDCFSSEASRTPAQWTCQSRNEFGVYHGESTLTLVAVDTSPDDPICGVFEDEDAFEDSNDNDSAVASGMRADDD